MRILISTKAQVLQQNSIFFVNYRFQLKPLDFIEQQIILPYEDLLLQIMYTDHIPWTNSLCFDNHSRHFWKNSLFFLALKILPKTKQYKYCTLILLKIIGQTAYSVIIKTVTLGKEGTVYKEKSSHWCTYKNSDPSFKSSEIFHWVRLGCLVTKVHFVQAVKLPVQQ